MNILFRNKQTAFLSVILACISVGAMLYFAFFPALKGFQMVSQQIEEKKTGLSTIKTPRVEQGELDGKVSKTKEQLEILKKRIFWESDIGRFLNEITLLAADLKISFVSLKPEAAAVVSAEKDKKSAQDYPLTEAAILIIMRSNYNDLVKFLERIEQNDKFIAVQSLQIETDQQDVYSHTIRMDLSIFTQ